ncbi:hypothetical protein [Streptosporangium sp. V21-05]|uniref:hypothetical protein n=1 Tax=Streptosporangium sp. V21-05 TaxID=3446115 RepID=UPI003F52E9A7
MEVLVVGSHPEAQPEPIALGQETGRDEIIAIANPMGAEFFVVDGADVVRGESIRYVIASDPASNLSPVPKVSGVESDQV